MDTLYIEEEVLDHPRVRGMRERCPKAETIICERYSEVFNVKGQNFRWQKRKPSWILAKKHGRMVLPTPPEYGIGCKHNFYFSHILNCPYDCRYCFLQGMFRSAHQVWFVNYEDIQQAIDDTLSEYPEDEIVGFFSGYDGDSLALENLTGFADNFLPFFEKRPRAILELRTKSVNVKTLTSRQALENVVVAFSLSPRQIAEKLEHGAPNFDQRLKALRKVAEQGWPIGLRLDPLIAQAHFSEEYQRLIDEIFAVVNPDQVHSVTYGPMRFPEAMFERMSRLYPDERLFAAGFEKRDGGLLTYAPQREEEMRAELRRLLAERLPVEKLFDCVGS
ncbi:MAG: DNA photolyase [Verrucomicrobia bacterium]|nr:DNA photolyase [Verrucomicrobiota bacterium]